jgi:hypothetical protein
MELGMIHSRRIISRISVILTLMKTASKHNAALLVIPIDKDYEVERSVLDRR